MENRVEIHPHHLNQPINSIRCYCKFLTNENENNENQSVLQDFEGQGRAEKLSRIIITLFGIVGLVWGGIVQQFSQTIFILAAGVLLTLIVSTSSIISFGMCRGQFGCKIHEFGSLRTPI